MNIFKRFFFGAAVLLVVLFVTACDNASTADTNSDLENPNNYPVRAITVDTRYQTEQIEAYDQIYYKFTAPISGVYTIILTNVGSDLSWALFSQLVDPDLDLLCATDTSNSAENEVGLTNPLEAGETYFIVIDEWDDIDSYFDLLVTSEPFTIDPENPNNELLQTITVNTSYENMEINGYNSVFFKFTAPLDGVYTISLTNLTEDLEWVLFTQLTYDGESYLCNTNDSPWADDEIGTTTPLEAGETYFITVIANVGSDSSFDLLVTTPGL